MEQQAFLIALSGSFDVVLKDGKSKKVMTLNKPNIGLLIVDGIWRVGKFFIRERFVWFCLQLYSMKLIISAIIKILNYLKDR
jgi:hypothetical protein